ncbi:MAG: signal peptide peptidase SppA [Candidatus Edwardsbacteria bacterium]
MSKKKWIVLGVLGGILLLFFVCFFLAIVISFLAKGSPEFPSFGKAIALIEVIGPLDDATSITRQLKKYRESEDIKAIVLKVDSPGGGAAVAQEIYEEIKKTREKGKYVICSMSSVAASGGYYIACACDSIFANPGTITGSIGVIAQMANFEGLLKKIGVRFTVVKSGEHKDIASPFREMTEEEKRLIQNLLDDVYHQFIDAVCEGRNLKREEVLKIADGRILSGRQAKAYRLVDRLGDLEDAIDLAVKLSGIKGKPRIEKEKKRTIGLFNFLGSFSGLGKNPDQALKVEYRMVP